MPDDNISLRDHITQLLDAEKKVCNERQKQLLEQRAAHRREHALESKALRLQAAEYKRRLEDLNHAHELAQEVLGTYLPREIYDADTKEVEKRLRILEDWRSNLIGRSIAIGFLLALIAAGVSSLTTWLLSKGG